jgi:hypothetical protein
MQNSGRTRPEIAGDLGIVLSTLVAAVNARGCQRGFCRAPTSPLRPVNNVLELGSNIGRLIGKRGPLFDLHGLNPSNIYIWPDLGALFCT